MPLFKLGKRRTRVYGQVGKGGRPESGRFLSRIKKLSTGRSWWFWIKSSAILCAVGFVAATIVVAWVSKDLPNPGNISNRQVAESTKIYDRTGKHLLYEVYLDKKRTVVKLSEMSPWLPKATVAIEDKRFYEHKGIQIKSIIRATINNLIGRRSGSGGASTLTQQLIKNVIVGNERSIFRKIKEAILAIRLERSYSKDEILEFYLNEIPYGSTNYGVEAASRSYFRKSAKELSLSEAAALAAMIQAPSRYLNNPQILRSRRDLVLGLMKEQGMITDEQKSAAQNEALRIYRGGGILAAPHFVLHVKQLLADQFGEQIVDTGGLKVITTLDYDLQTAAEKIVKEQGEKFAKEANANNAALVALNPKTAEILAMVGSRDFFNDEIDGQFNIVTLGRLQPGSSFKPIVYTAAFAKGYTPDTVVYDVKTDFDLRVGSGGAYIPQNYDLKERGLVTLRKALQGSLNIPAVKVLYLVGLQSALDFAKRFGYTTLTGDYGLTLVLGGGEVNPLEHTNAYATLANGGTHRPPASILSVEAVDGRKLLEWEVGEGTEAVTPELAGEITNVLADNNARAYIFGQNNNLILPDRKVAAKTGTTQNNWDAWTIGYVPSLAAGVWVGNTPAHLPMKLGGNRLAAVIWNQFMRAALKNTPPEAFPSSSPNTAVKPVLRGSDGGIRLLINRSSGKIATSSTPAELIEERTFLPPHDILQYVNKDDPRGPYPERPADDPQYANWESALVAWAKREEAAGRAVSLSEPPTEYDTVLAVDNGDLTPVVRIVEPANAAILANRQIEAKVEAAAARGIAEVVYYIDGNEVFVAKDYPFALSFYAQALAKGDHTLKAVAKDDLGNSAGAEVVFTLTAELEPPSAAWVDKSPLVLSAEDFPRAMYLLPWRWSDTKNLKIFLDDRLIYTFFGDQDKLTGGKLFFTWRSNPGAGAHILKASVEGKDGAVTEKELMVEVR